ncbi:ABC transporter ATP-binding protein [Actinoalloteichus spitiensis]|uniref:ABC transporter ATP-binding protein n=1 Tax=Actinoalloteichus spitiensis TaxID=252394 RepID=UPI00036D10BD|nr:ABC transporter ATP-binding protein [Actinoalloteichus spitiensis]
MTTMLEVSDLGHTYGSGDTAYTAISGLSFTVDTGELTCIVGPSGCGKSTLLRAIAGLHTPTSGTVRLKGETVAGVPEDLAVVFQDYSRSLFPWLTVRDNVEFPLRSRGVPAEDRARRAAEALEWVGLGKAGKKYPWQLSGGMQQRVSIARALACRPSLLLMDEPFASVDAQTRFELEDLLLRVRRELNATVLLVTHDIDESVYLGDRVLVLSKPPATVVAELPVDLPPVRDQITTRESDAFVSLRSEVARLLHGKEPAATPARGAAARAAGAVDQGGHVAESSTPKGQRTVTAPKNRRNGAGGKGRKKHMKTKKKRGVTVQRPR